MRLPFSQLLAEAQSVTAMRVKGMEYRAIGQAHGHSHVWAWARYHWLQDQMGYVGRLSRHHRVPIRSHNGPQAAWWEKNIPLGKPGPWADLHKVDAALAAGRARDQAEREAGRAERLKARETSQQRPRPPQRSARPGKPPSPR
jgi:hypothetical protein